MTTPAPTSPDRTGTSTPQSWFDLVTSNPEAGQIEGFALEQLLDLKRSDREGRK